MKVRPVNWLEAAITRELQGITPLALGPSFYTQYIAITLTLLQKKLVKDYESYIVISCSVFSDCHIVETRKGSEFPQPWFSPFVILNENIRTE